MQNSQNKDRTASAGEQTLELGKSSFEVVEEPRIKTKTVSKDVPAELNGNRQTSQTAQLLPQPLENSDLQYTRDDLRYSSASNIESSGQKNLHSAKELQAALPSNFEVKIKKIGTQVQTGQQSKKQFESGDYYQGAPPNYFMRKGSASSSMTHDKITPNLTPLDRYNDSHGVHNLTTHGLEETNKVIFGQASKKEKHAQISLAVETRNAMTGTRKKIIKSAVNSISADDRQSD